MTSRTSNGMYARITIVSAIIVMSFSLFGTAGAQTPEEHLSATIRAAILSDPRSQGMTPEEVDTMTAALTRQAQSVGMTAQDIVWRPTIAGSTGMQESAQPVCDDFLCNLNNAFGFDGSNYTIPIWLGISSLLLIFLIATVLEYRHLHHKKMAAQSGPTQMPPSVQ